MATPTYQVFESEIQLIQYVISLDPMKSFKPVKRDMSSYNWEPRECNECHTTFQPEHAAQHFCKKCQEKKDRKHKRESVIDRMKKHPPIEECISCGLEFYKTAPAMRKCKICSTKGGELVHINEEQAQTETFLPIEVAEPFVSGVDKEVIQLEQEQPAKKKRSGPKINKELTQSEDSSPVEIIEPITSNLNQEKVQQSQLESEQPAKKKRGRPKKKQTL